MIENAKRLLEVKFDICKQWINSVLTYHLMQRANSRTLSAHSLFWYMYIQHFTKWIKTKVYINHMSKLWIIGADWKFLEQSNTFTLIILASNKNKKMKFKCRVCIITAILFQPQCIKKQLFFYTMTKPNTHQETFMSISVAVIFRFLVLKHIVLDPISMSMMQAFGTKTFLWWLRLRGNLYLILIKQYNWMAKIYYTDAMDE